MDYSFEEKAEERFGTWTIRLVLRHHQGHHVAMTPGWEILEFSIVKKRDGAGDHKTACTFQRFAGDSILDVRKWLMKFRDGAVLQLLVTPWRWGVTDPDPDSGFLRAMLRLDERIRALELLSNDPDE